MQRKSRLLIGSLIVLSALVRAIPSQAQVRDTGPTGRSVVVSDTLLGIRLEKNYMKDVLRRFGQPQEIIAGSPRMTPAMAPTGGTPGAGGTQGSPQGLPNFPNGGPPGGAPPGGNPYANRGGGGGGFGNGSNFGGGPNQADVKYVEKNEVTWWYRVVRKNKPTIHYSFLFDREGRVIQIQEYGFSEGGLTKEGIGLGASLNDVVKRYGWSNDGERMEVNKLNLRYGISNKLAFQMVDNKVLGITLAKVK